MSSREEEGGEDVEGVPQLDAPLDDEEEDEQLPSPRMGGGSCCSTTMFGCVDGLMSKT